MPGLTVRCCCHQAAASQPPVRAHGRTYPGPPAALGHTEGDASAIGAYWMDVYDGEGNVVIRSYCASPPGGYVPPGSLAEYADDQLIGELEWRLRGR